MKRIVSTAALAGVLVFAGGNAAMAATYPAPVPTATVSDGTVAPGEAVTFSGSGFTPGEPITITASNEAPVAAGFAGGGGRAGASVGSIIAPLEVKTLSTTADAKGNFSANVVLSETGTYTLTATGQQSGRTVNSTVTVADPTAAAVTPEDSGEGLASTGLDASLLTWGAVGIVALVAGGVSVAAVRRKSANIEA